LITIKVFPGLIIEKEELKQEISNTEINENQDMPAITGSEDNPAVLKNSLERT